MQLKSKPALLVVEDDEIIALGLLSMLSDHARVVLANSKQAAIEALKNNHFDMAMIDLTLDHDLCGFELIELATTKNIYTIVLSGHDEDEYVEKSYLHGCQDYLTKPFDHSSLKLVFEKYIASFEQGNLQSIINTKYITANKETIHALNPLKEINFNDRPIFIQGPTGVGKTMLAKLIHELTGKKTDKFIHLNCAEIPENLLEAELFGAEKGSYTGSTAKRKGKLLMANEGTLFLDEVTALPLQLQKKLLKAIEEKTFYPVGADIPIKSNFRLVSATCDDISSMISNGQFRSDLYYRLEGNNIILPALKERKEDIPLLIKHILKRTPRRIVLSSESKDIFQKYDWPGNIRELQKVIEILSSKAAGIIRPKDLPEQLRSLNSNHQKAESSREETSVTNVLTSEQLNFIRKHGLKKLLGRIEEETVKTFFNKNNRKVRSTIKELKISNNTFYNILARIDKAQEGLIYG